MNEKLIVYGKGTCCVCQDIKRCCLCAVKGKTTKPEHAVGLGGICPTPWHVLCSECLKKNGGMKKFGDYYNKIKPAFFQTKSECYMCKKDFEKEKGFNYCYTNHEHYFEILLCSECQQSSRASQKKPQNKEIVNK